MNLFIWVGAEFFHENSIFGDFLSVFIFCFGFSEGIFDGTFGELDDTAVFIFHGLQFLGQWLQQIGAFVGEFPFGTFGGTGVASFFDGDDTEEGDIVGPEGEFSAGCSLELVVPDGTLFTEFSVGDDIIFGLDDFPIFVMDGRIFEQAGGTISGVHLQIFVEIMELECEGS